MEISDVIRTLKNQLTDQQTELYRGWTNQARQDLSNQYGGNLPAAIHQETELRFLAHLLSGDRQILLDPAQYEQLITERLAEDRYRSLRATDEARKRFAAEEAGTLEIPTPAPLNHFIEQSLHEDEEWRIQDLWPALGRILLAAQYKAGKTTLIANLIRALVDGEPFLGQFPITPARGKYPNTGGVLLIDTEMTTRQLGRWLHNQNITNQDAVEILTLRGQLSGFNILTPEGRLQWAKHIEGAEVVILDNLRPVLDALGLDENREAGRFLTAWDELMAEMSVKESLIVTHTGHHGERARGDSALLASNDGMWSVLRQNPDDLTSPRYFRAYGRGFDQPENILHHDPTTGRLQLGQGNRTTAQADQRLTQVLEFLHKSPGTSVSGIRAGIAGDQKITSKATELGISLGWIERLPRKGRGGGFCHELTEEGREQLQSDQNT